MPTTNKMIGCATLINGDCMDYMRSLPDKAFDLAIVDPPYGDGNFQASPRKRVRPATEGGDGSGDISGRWNCFGAMFDRYKRGPSQLRTLSGILGRYARITPPPTC